MVNIYWYKTQLYLLDSFNSSIIKTYWIYLICWIVFNYLWQKWGPIWLGADLTGADLIEADLTGADLTLGRFGLGPIWPVTLYTTLCDKVCHWLTAGQWFSLCAPVSSTNKTDRHNIIEIMLEVALNAQTQKWLLLFVYK